MNTLKAQTSQPINAQHPLIHADMKKIDQLIAENLQSKITLINQISQHITNNRGKRLRPILLLLTAKHFSCAPQNIQHAINLATIIELIHTATLLHDDVVDASLLRRGQQTANQLWGNETSVLVGDFLYSRAFQMMVRTDSIRIMEVLSEATNTIAEGEVQQLINCHDPDIIEHDYLDVIHNKTAKLFEAATRLGAILSQRSADEEQQIAQYGMHLGTAFQLIDDTLDYSESTTTLGKNIGDDLAEGKPTLPLLYAMWNSNEKDSQLIRQAIINGTLNNLDNIIQIIIKTGAIEYTTALAQQEIQLAISILDNFSASQYLDAMYNLAEYSVTRNY